MDCIEYRNIRDRTGWKPGPWDDEPDKIQWQDKATGLPCLIVRNHYGTLCGYVGVAEGHPFFGKGYDDIEVSVHGGLTFADRCQENDAEHGICHIPAPGEPDHVWWFGFDCAHAFDKDPCERFNFPKSAYRNIAYVTNECTQLAAQLRAMK